jgi:hypothetical protein
LIVCSSKQQTSAYLGLLCPATLIYRRAQKLLSQGWVVWS